jgi:hypothetical protein
MYFAGAVIEPDQDQIGLTGGDGDFLRLKTIKGKLPIRVIIGFFGLLLATWSFWYAWIVGWFGGHRSWLSHGILVGTLGRVVWWNIPLAFLLEQVCVGIGWPMTSWGYELYLDVWLVPYFGAQLAAWLFSDGIHLLLDTEWAKKYMYVPAKNRKKNTKVILINIPQFRHIIWKRLGV